MIDKKCILVITTCACILVCLAYVQLCRDMTQRIKDPNQPEYWQVKTLALQYRDSVKEAQQDYLDGEINVFDINTLVPQADRWIAELTISDAKQQATEAAGIPVRTASAVSTQSLLQQQSKVQALKQAKQAFMNSSASFANEYNREMTRLLN